MVSKDDLYLEQLAKNREGVRLLELYGNCSPLGQSFRIDWTDYHNVKHQIFCVEDYGHQKEEDRVRDEIFRAAISGAIEEYRRYLRVRLALDTPDEEAPGTGD